MSESNSHEIPELAKQPSEDGAEPASAEATPEQASAEPVEAAEEEAPAEAVESEPADEETPAAEESAPEAEPEEGVAEEAPTAEEPTAEAAPEEGPGEEAPEAEEPTGELAADEPAGEEAEAAEASEAEAAQEEAPAEEGSEEPAGEQGEPLPAVIPSDDERLALLEAIIYVAEEPLTADQICGGLALPREVVVADLTRLVEAYAGPQRGVEVRKVAGGYKMYTKAEHHEAVRGFVKSLQAKLKLSKPAFETLAVIAYKQPITVPEIQAIRGVNASGTIHTLLKHKLITSAGRKKVIGKPMMYKTTREFLVQFGLDDLGELPNLKEFEELSRAALGDEEPEGVEEAPAAEGSAADEPAADGQPEPEAELAAIEEEAADRMEAEAEAAEETAEDVPEEAAEETAEETAEEKG